MVRGLKPPWPCMKRERFEEGGTEHFRGDEEPCKERYPASKGEGKSRNQQSRKIPTNILAFPPASIQTKGKEAHSAVPASRTGSGPKDIARPPPSHIRSDNPSPVDPRPSILHQGSASGSVDSQTHLNCSNTFKFQTDWNCSNTFKFQTPVRRSCIKSSQRVRGC